MKELRDLLLKLSDDQLDAKMHPLIQKWDEQPKAIQILEVLDHCINASLASGFVVATLQAFLEVAMKSENTDLASLVKLAIWRKGVS